LTCFDNPQDVRRNSEEDRRGDGSYSLFVYVGLSLWTFYANAVTLAASSLVGSSH